jgi:putative chitinase
MKISKLAGHIPERIIQALKPDFLLKAKIDGPKRLAHFLGQLIEECRNFTRFTENLNYRAEVMAKTWPGRYAVDPKAEIKVPNDLAKKLEHNPVAIANNCYCDRNGNGDEASGEGWKYRGRGPNMITGKGTYQAFQDWLESEGYNYDVMGNPDIVATDITVGLLSAVWFFSIYKKIWPLCDQGVEDSNIKAVTKKVNGGLTNLEKRILYTKAIYKALTV